MLEVFYLSLPNMRGRAEESRSEVGTETYAKRGDCA